jgi:hypothetical protein
MEEIVNLKLSFGEDDFLSTELIFQLDELVLKLDPALALVVEVSFEAILGLPELLPLILKHELELPIASMVLRAIYNLSSCTSCGDFVVASRDIAISEVVLGIEVVVIAEIGLIAHNK